MGKASLVVLTLACTCRASGDQRIRLSLPVCVFRSVPVTSRRPAVSLGLASVDLKDLWLLVLKCSHPVGSQKMQPWFHPSLSILNTYLSGCIRSSGCSQRSPSPTAGIPQTEPAEPSQRLQGLGGFRLARSGRSRAPTPGQPISSRRSRPDRHLGKPGPSGCLRRRRRVTVGFLRVVDLHFILQRASAGWACATRLAWLTNLDRPFLATEGLLLDRAEDIAAVVLSSTRPNLVLNEHARMA